MDDPIQGWIDNFNGPVGLLVASGKGIMRSVYTQPDIKADYMPVDIAIKAMIVAAWQRGLRKLTPTDEVPVINCCASGIKQITFQELINIGMAIANKYPLNDILWIPGGSITSNKLLHYFKVIFLHLLPALLVDGILKLAGRKPMLFKLQRRIYIANLALQYYITNQWTFINKQFFAMRDTILPDERADFSYPFEHVDVSQFFINCIHGGRKYLLKEPDSTIPQARRHHQRMIVLNAITRITFWCLIIWWIVNSQVFGSVANYLWDFIVGAS